MLGCHIIQFPSGRWGFVGRVPTTLGDEIPASRSGVMGCRTHRGVDGEILTWKFPTFESEDATREYARVRGVSWRLSGELRGVEAMDTITHKGRDFHLASPDSVSVEVFDWSHDVNGNLTAHHLIMWSNGLKGNRYAGGHYRSKRRAQVDYGVVVTAKCTCCGDWTGESASLWGIASDDDYLAAVAMELAEEIA